MPERPMKRWYDHYPPLPDYFEKLRDMHEQERNTIICEMRDLLAELEPMLIDKTVMEYPLTYKRRWYDAEATSWLTINGLHLSTDDTKKQVIKLLKKHLS